MSVGRYQAYPEYKDSGLAWLGDMPKTWELRKAKHLFERVQRPVRESDGIVTAFRDGQVTLRSNRREDGFTNAVKEIGYQGVRNGDLLVHAMDGFAGAIGVSDSDGKCSPVCSVCTPWDMSQIDIRYYGYLVRQLAVTDYITSLAKGIRERSTEFRFSEFSGLELALPTKTEQTQIAAFLDHETAKIDRLIEKQQALISLLKEKRQAVISHAVTKGVNPHAPLKDSGIEWLGQVPAHWKSGKLGYSARISNGATPSRENAAFWNEGTVGWLNSGKINDEIVYEADQFITKLAVKQTSVQAVVENDLLIAITGEGQTRGRVAICKTSATINQHLASISLNHEQLNYEYVFYWLTSQYERIRFESEEGGSTKAAITCASIAAYPLPIPPIEEQIKIASFVSQQRARLDKLVERAFDQIILLQERRTALISAAVTGKIDVRHWQPPSAADAAADDGKIVIPEAN